MCCKVWTVASHFLSTGLEPNSTHFCQALFCSRISCSERGHPVPSSGPQDLTCNSDSSSYPKDLELPFHTFLAKAQHKWIYHTPPSQKEWDLQHLPLFGILPD